MQQPILSDLPDIKTIRLLKNDGLLPSDFNIEEWLKNQEEKLKDKYAEELKIYNSIKKIQKRKLFNEAYKYKSSCDPEIFKLFLQSIDFYYHTYSDKFYDDLEDNMILDCYDNDNINQKDSFKSTSDYFCLCRILLFNKKGDYYFDHDAEDFEEKFNCDLSHDFQGLYCDDKEHIDWCLEFDQIKLLLILANLWKEIGFDVYLMSFTCGYEYPDVDCNILQSELINNDTTFESITRNRHTKHTRTGHRFYVKRKELDG